MIGAKQNKNEIDLKIINKKKDEINLILEKLIKLSLFTYRKSN